MTANLFGPRRLPFWLALAAVIAGWSGLVRSPLGFVIFSVATFAALLCLRAVVRAKAKHREAAS